jgi:hypothetical protein
MKLKVRLDRRSRKYHSNLEWDSNTGRLTGSLAAEVAAGLEEHKKIGTVGWGPQACLEYPVTDPFHKPEKFALILDAMGFVLPAELWAVYPVPPDELLYDPELEAMTPEERSRVVF